MIPENEHDRLQAVYRHQILDTPPDGAFDRIAALAARYFAVPIATVSIVDHDRVSFKARHGSDVDEVGRPGQLLGPLDHVELADDTVRLAPGEWLLL